MNSLSVETLVISSLFLLQNLGSSTVHRQLFMQRLTLQLSNETQLSDFFWPRHKAYGIPVSWSGIRPMALKAPNPNHYVTRELPKSIYFLKTHCKHPAPVR